MFEGEPYPVALEEISVEPRDRIVPFTVGMQLSKTKGYIFGIRWRVLRNGQQVAIYELVKDEPGFSQAGHKFSEAGTYTVEATVKGIGSNGYAEATRSVTVVARPKDVPPPPSSNWRLSLRLAPVELSLNTLRIISAEWKVTPMWNPSQAFNLKGSNAENRYTAEVNYPH